MLKRMTPLVVMCGICSLSYGQTEKENPFTFEVSYVGDTYYNTIGGLKTGGGLMGMGNILIGFDTGKARWWQGGSFFVNGALIHGKSLTENYLGDMQVASNIDAGEHLYLHEFWFKQELGKMSLSFGLQDLNAEFMVSENAGGFINSSFGVPPVIATGIPVPIFPLTGLGFAVRWDVNGKWTVQGALFDGDQTAFDRNPHNIHWNFSREDGLLTMGEIHFNREAGTLKLGGYYHSADDNYGVYLFGDHTVFERNNRKLDLFAQVVGAPKGKNENNYSLGLGASLSGVFGNQQRDTIGFAATRAGLHRASRKHETALELYYKYPFNDNIALQPDIQYIINPSGTDEKLSNALVGILRLHVVF